MIPVASEYKCVLFQGRTLTICSLIRQNMSLGTAQAPIVIPEASPPGAENIIFSKPWRDGKSFKELLQHSGDLPSLIETTPVVGDTKTYPVLTPSGFRNLKFMPTTLSLTPVMEMIRAYPTSDPWISFKNHSMKHSTFTKLWHIVEVVSSLHDLKSMDRWLLKLINSKHDAKFAEYWRGQMHTFTMDSSFIRFGQQIPVQDFFKLMPGKWLTDVVLELIFDLFRHGYKGHLHGPHLFIPLKALGSWVECLDGSTLADEGVFWNWGTDIDLREYKKAYAIVHMNDHWGALAIDIGNRTISFGDSSNRSPPRLAIRAVMRWIELRLGVEEAQQWNKPVRKLSAKSATDGDSCGVIAAFAIENDINSCSAATCSCSESPDKSWNTVRSRNAEQLRVRYLSLLSGYSTV